MINALLVVVGIGVMFLILIAPHEGGHFLVAKLCKVRVIEFSIGAGPKLWSMTRGGTIYALRLLPILGYVRMGGMEAGDFNEPSGFHSRPPLQRIAILAAGPIANFLVAILLITGFGLTQLNDDPGKVQRVVPGSPAAAAGIQVGDSIRAVNGKPVSAPGFISKVENDDPGAPLVLTGVHPDGRAFTITLYVFSCSSAGSCQIGVGVAPRIVTVQSAVVDGVSFPIFAMGGIVQGLDALITGQVKGGLLGPQGLTGPIGIGAITAEQVSQGPPNYIFLVALLSVALGFTNLLPLLALDGGRIMVVVIEWLRRRPFDRNSELNVQRWGLVALLALAAVISFLDIQRIASGQFTGVH
ncbi:MAG: site-2 protease family protein [Chloroflexi bacterium]|nr:MAG: site-2 protease family protein [Chloroflexota bacterium]TMC69984.1 MAG: site-2 protease family protein [Chloroflexota bacterium]